jgi:hypothetical protein
VAEHIIGPMTPDQHAAYAKAIGIANAQAKRRGVQVGHVKWDGEHLEWSAVLPYPKEGFDLIAERSYLPEGFVERPKRKRQRGVQAELPL